MGDTVLTYALFVLLFYLWIGVFRSGHAFAAAWAGADKRFRGYIAMVLAAFSALKTAAAGVFIFFILLECL